MALERTYDYFVVVISAVITIAAIYAAIHRALPATGTGRWRRIAWLTAAAAILAGVLRIAHGFGLPAFGSQILYHYSAMVLVIGAAAVSSIAAIRTAKRDKAARANAVRFETLAEAIPQIIWIADASGRTTYINKRWFQMTGTSEQDAADGGWINQVHPDDRAPRSEKWQASVRSGETFEIEYRLHDAANGYRWYLDHAVPLPDDQGVIQQWFGNLHRHRGTKALSTTPRAADQGAHRRIGGHQYPIAAGDVGKRPRPADAR